MVFNLVTSKLLEVLEQLCSWPFAPVLVTSFTTWRLAPSRCCQTRCCFFSDPTPPEQFALPTRPKGCQAKLCIQQSQPVKHGYTTNCKSFSHSQHRCWLLSQIMNNHESSTSPCPKQFSCQFYKGASEKPGGVP